MMAYAFSCALPYTDTYTHTHIHTCYVYICLCTHHIQIPIHMYDMHMQHMHIHLHVCACIHNVSTQDTMISSCGPDHRRSGHVRTSNHSCAGGWVDAQACVRDSSHIGAGLARRSASPEKFQGRNEHDGQVWVWINKRLETVCC